jgi:O-antigen ligase
MPSSAMRLPRSVLWEAAFGIAREHPVLGIGPDNYRHTYGRRLGLAAWDERVHANNSYIEVLVGMGAIGVAAMVWLMFAAVRSGTRALFEVSDARLPIVAASFAACAAIAVHALVDSFLTFTPTYAVFAIAAGVLFSAHSSTRGEPC